MVDWVDDHAALLLYLAGCLAAGLVVFITSFTSSFDPDDRLNWVKLFGLAFAGQIGAVTSMQAIAQSLGKPISAAGA